MAGTQRAAVAEGTYSRGSGMEVPMRSTGAES